jgi:hypothetical protein
MPEHSYVPNHTVDPGTGFLESNGFPSAFTAERKQQFLNLYRSNGLGLFRTCRLLNMSCSTIHHHYRIDPVFKAEFDEAKAEYGDELEAVSRTNALNPKSVIERIFQLKALFPQKYGELRAPNTPEITINIDGNIIEMAKKRQQIIDVEPITSTHGLATESAGLTASAGEVKSESSDSVEQVDSQRI